MGALADIRKAAGYNTLLAASKALKVSRSHLEQLERGIGAASSDLQGRMEATYDVTRQAIRHALASDALARAESRLRQARAVSATLTP